MSAHFPIASRNFDNMRHRTYAIIRKLHLDVFSAMKTNDLPALLLPLLLLGLATSCISREYPVTSTYTETAFRTEYVTEA